MSQAIDRIARPGDVTVFWRGDEYVAYPSIAFAHSQFYRTKPYGPIVLLSKPPDVELMKHLHEAPGVLLLALRAEDAASAFPGATLTWQTYEPGAGALFRVTFPQLPTTQSVAVPQLPTAH